MMFPSFTEACRVPLVELLSAPPDCSGVCIAQSLVVCVVSCCRQPLFLVFIYFIVCPLIYGFDLQFYSKNVIDESIQ